MDRHTLRQGIRQIRDFFADDDGFHQSAQPDFAHQRHSQGQYRDDPYRREWSRGQEFGQPGQLGPQGSWGQVRYGYDEYGVPAYAALDARGMGGGEQAYEGNARDLTGGGQRGYEARHEMRHGDPWALSARKRGPKGYTRSDERIQEDISERLFYTDHIDSSDVSVSVQDGTVTLEGSVPERRMKHTIEDIVIACAGVKDVDNRIRVAKIFP